MDYSIKIGGEAGQGIETMGNVLARVLARSGYHVFAHQEYESRIRGGHNFFQIRLSDAPVSASRDSIDMLIALDKASITLHAKELSENGVVVYDSSALKEKHDDARFVDIPFVELALTHGHDRIMVNTVAAGAALGMLGLDLAVFQETMKDTLKKKDEATLDANQRAAIAGHSMAAERCLRCAFSLTPTTHPRMLMGTNEAIGLGAILSGCRFYSAYPMTPSTGIMIFLSGKAKKYGIVVEQAEDEIAAINMALGASFGGVRAMTGTSGGGFALMTEGLSLAAMTETPIVIALGQRPAPATGLPTRTEQADLMLALHAGHGEFPRVILAPGTPEQAFYLTNKAFDLSQKYQIPAFILSDQYLADSQWTMEAFDFTRCVYKEYRVQGEELQGLSEYKRHAFSETGVSPFGIPGDSRHVVVTDSDEHDEEGHLTEDAEMRKKMVDKRLSKKLPHIRDEIAPPLLYGNSRPEIVIVGWGSTYGVMKEAIDALSKHRSVAMLHFSEVYPLPRPDYLDMLRKAQLTICVEQNATGQLAGLLRAETGYEFHARINKYDGRPFLLETLLGEIDALIG